jgi:hypothetical protein
VLSLSNIIREQDGTLLEKESWQDQNQNCQGNDLDAKCVCRLMKTTDEDNYPQVKNTMSAATMDTNKSNKTSRITRINGLAARRRQLRVESSKSGQKKLFPTTSRSVEIFTVTTFNTRF